MKPVHVAILVVMLAAGCSATITPPQAPVDPVTIYVADYGRHSSLLLPNPSTGGWTEYSWGDWDWFALGNAHWYMIPRTMLFSDQATLGEQDHTAMQGESALQRALGADRLVPIRVAADRVDALRQRLNERFSARSLTLMRSNYSGMYQVKDDEDGHYWLMNNCNHETARWLRELGCNVHGQPLLSHYKLKSD